MTNRKLKKRLQKEADTLLQAKKEEMLSFYQPAREKRARGRRFPVRALVAAVLTAVLLATVVVAVSFNGSAPAVESGAPDSPELVSAAGSSSPAESTSADVSESVSPDVSGTESGSEPSDVLPGIMDLIDPYAIVEILEVTDETVKLDSYFFHPNHIYTKIKCKVLFSYIPKGFKNDGREASGASNYVPFDELQEIYLVNESVSDLRPKDVIFFQPEEMKTYTWAIEGNAAWVEDYRVYYGPVTDRDGQAKFLSFVDGKLVIPEGSFDVGLELANLEIKKILHRGSEGTHPALFEACPKYLFEDVLTVQQVIDFFNSCQAYREAFEVYGDKRPPSCVIYEESESFDEDD